ncbi:glycerophosphodiester phosphodiesterase [Winogradskyella eckloniae]|uniref:glycerophosphodiester phosphodiesterase family protein n=1 Tax=Winogradskyella eckloniae TaxID=1089306 RepID=UPI0015648AF0|nr:glycerophosphodiester phosphodiesterase family protein [Winogradskyella eckloniae]NRD20763.1 glycerophosphodiester phosphodiesterase [Winogradskyella eckloniae]
MRCNENKRQIDIQGHRGCRGLMPENTLPAFEKAIDLGVNTLELDIVISKDNKVVVSHEPFMNPVICLDAVGNEIPEALEKHYNLYDMNYNEIKQFDCGLKFHPSYPKQEKLKTYKPLLSDVFELVKQKKSNVTFNIEIKSEKAYYNIFTPQPDRYVKLVLDEITKHQVESLVVLQSFDVRILREIIKQSPETVIALLVEEDEDICGKISMLDSEKMPNIVSPYYKLLDATIVRNLKAENFKVVPWTVNETQDMKALIAWDVDGIISDYPDRLIKVLQE